MIRILPKKLFISFLALGIAITSFGKLLKIGDLKAESQFYVSTSIPEDNNGNKGAVIIITVPAGIDLSKIKVIGNEIGHEADDFEYKCYVSKGTRKLEINVPGYDPLTVNFKENNIEIESARTYKLKLVNSNAFQQLEDGDFSDGLVRLPVNGGYTLIFYVGEDLSEMTYLDAKKFCENLNAKRQGGYTGWRLPNMDEMLFFFGDYPQYGDDLQWIGYEGVEINGRTVEEEERRGHTRYTPCMTFNSLNVHKYYVNSKGQLTRGGTEEHGFFPCTAVAD